MAGFEVFLREGDVCIYCGEIAVDRDHVPPHASTGGLIKTFFRHEVVPACKNCNGALHAKPLLTIADRAAWLLRRFQKKIDAMPSPWTEAEISKLGHALQQYVRRNESKRTKLESQAAWCERLLVRATRVGLTPEMFWDGER